MSHTTARCCKKQHQQQKTPRAQQYTSSLLVPCAHGKLNVKHHRTTPKPEIYANITVEKEAALARKFSTKMYRSGAAAVRVRIQARPISTNPGCMETCEDGLTRKGCFVASRLEVVAVAGLLWISWCVWVGRFFRFCFIFFFPSNAHGLQHV